MARSPPCLTPTPFTPTASKHDIKTRMRAQLEEEREEDAQREAEKETLVKRVLEFILITDVSDGETRTRRREVKRRR